MTPNKEDYLKIIYNLGGNEVMVGNKQIAQAMQIAPASVTEMLNKLKREGLIDYEAYKGSRLTDKGRALAVGLVRGHRLWEVFLMRHLGYSWSEAHEDAELLEHIAPARLTNRLDQFLKHPAHCPHGNVIPRADGRVKSEPMVLLTDLRPGQMSYIGQVTEERELLDYAQQLGLAIGCPVRVIQIGAYEGPLTLDLAGKRVQISYKAASQIYVTPPEQ